MPRQNAIVTRIRAVTPVEAVEGRRHRIEVATDGDRTLRVEAEHPAAVTEILSGLRSLGRPVYLEVEPGTDVVTRLLIPHVGRVRGFDHVDGRLSVELEISHARHFLPDGEDAAGLEARLREAQERGSVVVVAEDDAHTIVDVRDYEPDPEGGPPDFLPRPEPAAPWWRRWLVDPIGWLLRLVWWPWWWFRVCISATRAQQVFDAMSATSCNPTSPSPPCIPFLYPDDGCWGRAHEMCRLMVGLGLRPQKVWIRGNLQVQTRNNPNCAVGWNWHVAPHLCVRGPFLFWHRQMVIDPSLFTSPVTKAQWKAACQDPNATLTDSRWTTFYLWTGDTDPTYAKTNQVLADYRLQLQNRSLQYGPPPYANCP